MRSLPLLVSYESSPAVVRAMAKELGQNSEETALSLDLFGQDLPPISSIKWIPFLFGVSPRLVGAMGRRPEKYYRRFQLKKASGGQRDIVAPRRFLKTIQRWILHHVLSHLPTDDSVYGFVQGRDIFKNAALHLSSRNLLSLDLEDFFPTLGKAQVKTVFREGLPFPPAVANQLSDLCTLDGAVPQGAPTSPALANAIFGPADQELRALAKEWDCVYTRYADDLAFSGARTFGSPDIRDVERIVGEHGFRLNGRKTRITGPGQRQVVAGIVVNEKGMPPRAVRKRWRAMFHRASIHPHEFSDRTAQLQGIAAFVQQFDPTSGERYRRVISELRSLTAQDTD